jgi:hypothetical protein
VAGPPQLGSPGHRPSPVVVNPTLPTPPTAVIDRGLAVLGIHVDGIDFRGGTVWSPPPQWPDRPSSEHATAMA